MRTTARQTRENRTITVDFRSEATYFQLLGNGKAFLECVIAFVMSLGFQLTHKATCRGDGCLTRHSHYVRVRLGGVTIWRLQCKPRQNSRYVYGWLSRPYADTPDRYLESPPQTFVFGASEQTPPNCCSRHDKILASPIRDYSEHSWTFPVNAS
jgi:hypothetical protein